MEHLFLTLMELSNRKELFRQQTSFTIATVVFILNYIKLMITSGANKFKSTGFLLHVPHIHFTKPCYAFSINYSLFTCAFLENKLLVNNIKNTSQQWYQYFITWLSKSFLHKCYTIGTSWFSKNCLLSTVYLLLDRIANLHVNWKKTPQCLLWIRSIQSFILMVGFWMVWWKQSRIRLGCLKAV